MWPWDWCDADNWLTLSQTQSVSQSLSLSRSHSRHCQWLWVSDWLSEWVTLVHSHSLKHWLCVGMTDSLTTGNADISVEVSGYSIPDKRVKYRNWVRNKPWPCLQFSPRFSQQVRCCTCTFPHNNTIYYPQAVWLPDFINRRSGIVVLFSSISLRFELSSLGYVLRSQIHTCTSKQTDVRCVNVIPFNNSGSMYLIFRKKTF